MVTLSIIMIEFVDVSKIIFISRLSEKVDFRLGIDTFYYKLWYCTHGKLKKKMKILKSLQTVILAMS